MKEHLLHRLTMVVTTRQSDSLFSRGRMLDEDKITKALDHATDLGAEYAEIRLVSETTNTASLKDGKLERAIPGQEVGVTMRILADGAWGVHSTSDIASIVDQVAPTLRLAKVIPMVIAITTFTIIRMIIMLSITTILVVVIMIVPKYVNGNHNRNCDCNCPCIRNSN